MLGLPLIARGLPWHSHISSYFQRRIYKAARVTLAPYKCSARDNLAYPGQHYFGSKKQNMITIPTKLANYDPENIKFFSQFVYVCFGNKLFSSFIICSCVGLQGHRSVTSVKLSRAVGLPYLKILLINPGYLLTLLLGLPWQ